MNRLPSAVVVAVAASFILACGGISQGAGKSSLGESLALLENVPNSPEKTAVRGMIEEAFIQVHRGDLGLFKVSGFKLEIEDAVEDGTITLAELRAIEGKAPWMAHPATIGPDARAALLAELESEGTSAATAVAAGGITGWDQGDLERRARSAGWSISDCYTYGDSGYKETSCSIQKSGLYGSVTLTHHGSDEDARWSVDGVAASHRDGRSSLTAYLSNEAEGKALADTLIAPGAVIPLEIGYYRKILEPAGWTLTDTYTSRDREGESLSFAALKSGLRADISGYMYYAGDPDDHGYEVGYGGVSIYKGKTTFSLTVQDEDAARKLIEALRGT